MFNKNKIIKLLSIATNPHVYLSRCKYLFIISHMRSRSSLLAHVLGSNPEIAGYSELHRKYNGPKDILILRGRVFLDTKESFKNKYVLDKILHNPYSLSNRIFEMKSTHFIFLLRKPESTLKSIFEMGKKTGIVWQNDPDLVLRYYTRRLEMMSNYAEHTNHNFFYIESDELVEDTTKILGNLTSWLNLKTPLSREYSVFKNTGKSGHGDPSGNIARGKIIATESEKTIVIPKHMLSVCQDAYASCKRVLLDTSRSYPP